MVLPTEYQPESLILLSRGALQAFGSAWIVAYCIGR